MTGWLLDTNILSELRRPKPEPKVLAFIAAIRDGFMALVNSRAASHVRRT